MTLKEFIFSRIRSFGHAFRGWGYVLKTQHNAWIHVAVSVIVFILAFWLKLPTHDWAILILTITMVFAAEFVNTAIEAVVDLASPVHHPLAKVGKDVGAAAVLIAALAAVLIGLLILGPPMWEKTSPWFGQSTRTEGTAFKGMELYSWQNTDGEWQYSILEGTNRNKTMEEVLAAPLNLQEVEFAIGKLAVGESLFWMNNVYDISSDQPMHLSFPPESVVTKIKDLAREKQINLYLP